MATTEIVIKESDYRITKLAHLRSVPGNYNTAVLHTRDGLMVFDRVPGSNSWDVHSIRTVQLKLPPPRA